VDMVSRCFALLLLLGVSAQTHFSPFLWATPWITSLSAAQKAQFHIPTCGIPQYNGQTMKFAADLPFDSWDPSSQRVLYIAIYNSSDFTGSVIADNKDPTTGGPIQEFSFPYQNIYGDLYILVTAGVAPTISFSLNVKIANKSLKSAAHPFPSPHSLQQADIISAPNAIVDLLQLLYDPTPLVVGSVADSPPLLIDFVYCPTQDSYQLEIFVVALDEISAFATYLCTDFSSPCNAQKGQGLSDPRGIAVNYVHLQTTYRQYTTIEAAIYGYGNKGQNNTFIFSVTTGASNPSKGVSEVTTKN